MTHPTEAWAYFRVYAPSRTDLDGCLRDVGATIPGLAAAGVLRWHFLRYADEVGPHLRLRLCLDGRAFGEAYRAVRGRLCAWHRSAPAEAGAYPADGILPSEGREARRSSPRGVQEDVYEPEWRKYRGVEGVRRSEEVFQASSVLTLQVLPAVQPAPGIGAAGLFLMQATAGLLGCPERRARFWREYAGYWRPAFDVPVAPTTADRARMARERHPLAWSLAREANDRAASLDWAVPAYLATVRAALEAAPPPARLHLLFHFIHLTNNRLGLLPPDEAFLADILALGEPAEAA